MVIAGGSPPRRAGSQPLRRFNGAGDGDRRRACVPSVMVPPADLLQRSRRW